MDLGIVIITIHYFYSDIWSCIVLYCIVLYYFLCLRDLRDLCDDRFVLPFLPPAPTLI